MTPLSHEPALGAHGVSNGSSLLRNPCTVTAIG